MIRHPIHTAGGLARADLVRVSEGIASSLRQFSTAQRLSALLDEQGPNRANGTARPSARERSAAAVNDLVHLDKINTPEARARIKQDANRRAGQAGEDNQKWAPKFRKLDLNTPMQPAPSASAITPAPTVITAPKVLRGGFRGRGGFSFNGARNTRSSEGQGAPAAGGPRGPRGPFPSRGRGARKQFNPNDGEMMGARRSGRPPRRDGGGGGGRPKGRGGRRGRDRDDGADDGPSQDLKRSPELIEMEQLHRLGVTTTYEPALTLDELANTGPAVAAVKSSFANNTAVVKQARLLGGGDPYDAKQVWTPDNLTLRVASAKGIFIPTPEVKGWINENTQIEFKPTEQATKDAVLQDAMLGMYKGPQFVEKSDTLGTVRNYTTKNNLWNTAASQRIEDKIRSLLPGGKAVPKPTPAAKKDAKA
ncbi:hypothetical protein GGR57DRAFT_455972 [Xylariaceae sp. FL1272]|nr:hypothetical protein GGR57DRAFT_455972 [Xylariaceae sp. FL1272]